MVCAAMIVSSVTCIARFDYYKKSVVAMSTASAAKKMQHWQISAFGDTCSQPVVPFVYLLPF